ncbi:MAG: carbohydrate-binding domain-containing protein [Clostridia bacterium]|nr:carbohydrate-binding domain-containing protein [Clostridia bacterium]
MKRNALTILIPILCIAVLLTGCALARTITSTLNSAASQTAEQTEIVTNASADAVTVPEDPDETTNDTTDPQTSDDGEASGAFSARDLSAEYDDETVTVQLTGSGAAVDSDKVSVTGSTVTITGSGTYLITGTLDNGSIIVDASKEDKVQLVLNGVSIHSDSYAAIYVKQADKVFITLADGTRNALSNGGSFTQLDDSNVDAVVFARDDITFNGTGSLTITSPAGHGIVGKDEVTIIGGVYAITSAKCAVRANDSIAVADGTFTLTAGTDGLHAENDEDDTLGNIYIAGGTFTIDANDDAVHANTLLQIDNGAFAITAAEGLEATYIQINGGDISISASDDGVNATRKSSAYTPTVEITGGTLTIVMGAGDTDGVDANGNIIITGGTVDVTGQSTFDYDGTATYTGGTVIVNGRQVSELPNQMMGGGMPGGMPGGGRG